MVVDGHSGNKVLTYCKHSTIAVSPKMHFYKTCKLFGMLEFFWVQDRVHIFEKENQKKGKYWGLQNN